MPSKLLHLISIGYKVAGKRSRNKGASYERHIAHLFRDLGFEKAKRHLESQPSEAGFGRDLDGTQPFAMQLKCWKSTPSISAIDEIIPSEEYPIRVAILKRTQSKGRPGLEVAVVDLNVFINIVSLLLDSIYAEDLAKELLWSEDE